MLGFSEMGDQIAMDTIRELTPKFNKYVAKLAKNVVSVSLKFTRSDIIIAQNYLREWYGFDMTKSGLEKTKEFIKTNAKDIETKTKFVESVRKL